MAALLRETVSGEPQFGGLLLLYKCVSWVGNGRFWHIGAFMPDNVRQSLPEVRACKDVCAFST
jgi:hypothetical protein